MIPPSRSVRRLMAERSASREGIRDVGRVGAKPRKVTRGASTGRELLDKHHGQDHLAYERCSLLPAGDHVAAPDRPAGEDRKSTRLNSSHAKLVCRLLL